MLLQKIKQQEKNKEEVETRNSADSLVFQTKKQIEELKDKLPEDQKSQLEAEITKVEDALKTNNTETIKAATDSLNKIWGEISQQMYAQQGAEGQPEPDAQGAQQDAGQQEEANDAKSDEEDVQDASYEVVDDEEEKK
jgi:molecular chaperone DnaK